MKHHYFTFIYLLFPSEGRGRKAWKTPNKTIIFNPRYVQLEIFFFMTPSCYLPKWTWTEPWSTDREG